MSRLVIQLNPEDNVAVAIKDIEPGTKVAEDLIALDFIPQAHKIALHDIPKGG